MERGLNNFDVNHHPNQRVAYADNCAWWRNEVEGKQYRCGRCWLMKSSCYCHVFTERAERYRKLFEEGSEFQNCLITIYYHFSELGRSANTAHLIEALCPFASNNVVFGDVVNEAELFSIIEEQHREGIPASLCFMYPTRDALTLPEWLEQRRQQQLQQQRLQEIGEEEEESCVDRLAMNQTTGVGQRQDLGVLSDIVAAETQATSEPNPLPHPPQKQKTNDERIPETTTTAITKPTSQVSSEKTSIRRIQLVILDGTYPQAGRQMKHIKKYCAFSHIPAPFVKLDLGRSGVKSSITGLMYQPAPEKICSFQAIALALLQSQVVSDACYLELMSDLDNWLAYLLQAKVKLGKSKQRQREDGMDQTPSDLIMKQLAIQQEGAKGLESKRSLRKAARIQRRVDRRALLSDPAPTAATAATIADAGVTCPGVCTAIGTDAGTDIGVGVGDGATDVATAGGSGYVKAVSTASGGNVASGGCKKEISAEHQLSNSSGISSEGGCADQQEEHAKIERKYLSRCEKEGEDENGNQPASDTWCGIIDTDEGSAGSVAAASLHLSGTKRFSVWTACRERGR